MKLAALPLSLLSVCFLCDVASAARFSVSGRQTRARNARSSGLERRASISGVGVSTLQDVGDVQYYTNITIARQSFTVGIDTGSSDLWVQVNGSLPGTTDTGITSGVAYAVGEVTGPLLLGDLEFAGYIVPNQAFMAVSPANNSDSSSLGLIGLGPNSGSENFIAAKKNESALPPLDRIFRQNTTTPNFITVLLGRANDTTEPFPGDLTVGEVVPGYEAISSQPQLNISQEGQAATAAGQQHWQTLMDADGITVNGQTVSGLTTSVSATSNNKQLTAVFDSGFSLPQVPKAIAAAFYGSISGAKLHNVDPFGDIWQVPCDAEVNITFSFGGVKLPIHPLDAAADFQSADSDDPPLCVGLFQPITFDTKGNFDMILGMAFLRNAYMLVNLGDFVDGSPANTADGYIQFLSLTNDSALAHQDFLAERAPVLQQIADDSGHSKRKRDEIIGIIVGVLGIALILGITILVCCVKGIRNVLGKLFHPRRGGPAYRNLEAPAPGAGNAIPMYQPGHAYVA